MGIICIFRKLINFITLKNDISPHIYKTKEVYSANIAVGEDYFYETKGYKHNEGEYIVENATIEVSECIYCGKEEKSWYQPGNYEMWHGQEITTFKN